MSFPRPVKNVSNKPMDDLITVAKPFSSKQLPPKYAPLHQHLVSNTDATSTSTKLSPQATVSRKKEPTCKMITIDTSSMGITGLREPTCTKEFTEVKSSFQTANANLGDRTAEFQTADDGLPPATRAQVAPDAEK